VRLFEIAREINPNSCFIENVSELDSEWFHGISSVGVTAGASTPPWVIEKTMLFLTSFKA
jgi:4-hydroxy-3-methylbut-2-enyl diphosphate reductase